MPWYYRKKVNQLKGHDTSLRAVVLTTVFVKQVDKILSVQIIYSLKKKSYAINVKQSLKII